MTYLVKYKVHKFYLNPNIFLTALKQNMTCIFLYLLVLVQLYYTRTAL
jgi:hypothetical protein